MDETSLRELLSSPLEPPRPRRTRDPRRSRGILLIGGAAVVAAGLTVTAALVLGSSEDAELPPPPEPAFAVRDNPEPRMLADMVFDTGVGRAVMFGGEIVSEQSFRGVTGETWQYEGTEPAWWLLQSDDGPSDRAGPKMVFDEESGKTVLFGGAGSRFEPCMVARWCGGTPLGDTWTFDAGAGRWTDVTPEGSPAARAGHGGAYDPVADVMVVFGGVGVNEAGRTLVLSDTWVYDTNANTWTEVTPPESPAGRGNHAMVYDPASATVLMWGGVGPNVRAAELWAFDVASSTWSLLNPDPGIGIRLMTTAVHAGVPGLTVLIGGEGSRAPDDPGTSLVYSDEVFVINGTAIEERRPHDPPIWRHSAAYDPGADRIIVTFLESTWLYDAGTDEWEDVTEQSRSLLGRPFTP